MKMLKKAVFSIFIALSAYLCFVSINDLSFSYDRSLITFYLLSLVGSMVLLVHSTALNIANSNRTQNKKKIIKFILLFLILFASELLFQNLFKDNFDFWRAAFISVGLALMIAFMP